MMTHQNLYALSPAKAFTVDNTNAEWRGFCSAQPIDCVVLLESSQWNCLHSSFTFQFRLLVFGFYKPYVSSVLKPVRLWVCTHRLTPQCWLSRSWWRIFCKLFCGGCQPALSSSAHSSCAPSKPSSLASSGKGGRTHQLCPCALGAARASSI